MGRRPKKKVDGESSRARRTIHTPPKWSSRGQSREMLQYGAFTHANRVQLNVPLQRHLPPILAKAVASMEDRGVYSDPKWLPDACTVNVYAEGNYLPSHVDSDDFCTTVRDPLAVLDEHSAARSRRRRRRRRCSSADAAEERREDDAPCSGTRREARPASPRFSARVAHLSTSLRQLQKARHAADAEARERAKSAKAERKRLRKEEKKKSKMTMKMKKKKENDA